MKKHNIILSLFVILFSANLLMAQCIEESHSPFEDQGWLSCSESISAIPERGVNHWIMYDFKYSYRMLDLQIWNHNVWGETGMGVKSIIIDYSTNAMDWTTLGPIDVEKASGSWKYAPNDIIDLTDVVCRYMLITVVDTWDDASPCAGFGEIRINVDGIISSQEELLVDNYSVFPNPASELIQIDLGDGEQVLDMNMYDAMGRLITRIPVSSDKLITVPVDYLENGMYYISISNKYGTLSKPFAKI